MQQSDESSPKTVPIDVKLKIYAVALMLVAILLGGCNGGPATGVDVCGPWRPIYLSTSDQLTQATGRQILAHNEIGERLCGWQPARN